MKVYLAGPMRGYNEFNFPAFHAAAKKLRTLGHDVFSPAERDNERHGVDISKGNLTGSEEEAASNFGFSLREALGEDVAWICANAQAIALLPGWEKSTGAVAERALGKALGLEIVYLDQTHQPTYIHAVDAATQAVRSELLHARSKFGPFHGAHEGYGVMLEEVDEMWDDIKANKIDLAKKEAIQVAAMAVSFVVDVP